MAPIICYVLLAVTGDKGSAVCGVGNLSGWISTGIRVAIHTVHECVDGILSQWMSRIHLSKNLFTLLWTVRHLRPSSCRFV